MYAIGSDFRWKQFLKELPLPFLTLRASKSFVVAFPNIFLFLAAVASETKMINFFQLVFFLDHFQPERVT